MLDWIQPLNKTEPFGVIHTEKYLSEINNNKEIYKCVGV